MTDAYFDPTTNTYYGEGYEHYSPPANNGSESAVGGDGSESSNSLPSPSRGDKDAPSYIKTRGQRQAKRNYLDYIRWQRRELLNLISRYRNEVPLQVAAYKESAYGALPEKQKSLWGNMYANLHQRGLSDSASFLGGAKQGLEEWLTGEKQSIEENAQAKEMSAQQAILAALGKPNYGQLYQQWNDFDRMLNDATYKKWLQKQK